MRAFFLSLALVACCLASPAQANSNIKKMEPEASAILGASPEFIKIRFVQPIRPKESFIRVLDKEGTQMNSDILIASQDEKMLTSPLPELEFGTYTVEWKALCQCNAQTAAEGTYQFTIR